MGRPKKEKLETTLKVGDGIRSIDEEAETINEEFKNLIPESSLRQNDPGNLEINSDQTVEFLKDCAVGAAETFMTNKETKPAQCLIESLRDSRGLLKGVEYKFKENGKKFEDFSCIYPEHIALNRDVFKKKGIDLATLPPEKIEELKKEATDKEVFLLLAGIRYLYELRGATSVIQTPLPIESRAVVSCVIQWIPNFESNNQAIIFSDVGGASLENTNGFGQKYLDSIAANRAFVRAVRNFLKIEIVASDEVGSATDVNEENSSSNISSAHQPHLMLAAQLEKSKLSFEKLKEMLLNSPKEKDNYKEIESWKRVEDVPNARAISLTERLINRDKAKAKE